MFIWEKDHVNNILLCLCSAFHAQIAVLLYNTEHLPIFQQFQ